MSFGRLEETPEAIRPHGTRTECVDTYQPTFSKNPIPLPADRGQTLRGSVNTKFRSHSLPPYNGLLPIHTLPISVCANNSTKG